MKLKTLKDLREVFNVLAVDKTHIKIGNKVHTGGYFDIVYTKKLRQEAIKWIKEDIEEYRTAKIFEDNSTTMDWRKIHNFIVSQRQKWKDRFNITDEDLK